MNILNENKFWSEALICAGCGSSEFFELFNIFKKKYVTCNNCNLTRMYDRVAEDYLHVLYDNYHSPKMFTPVDVSKDSAAIFRRKRLEKFVPVEQRKIFEIGCGDGNTLAHLKYNSWEVDGIEFSEKTSELIKYKHSIQVQVGNFNQIDIPSDSFGVIAAYHVLEHLYSPIDYFVTARRLLKKEGILHIQVPNFGSLEAGLAGNCWADLSFPFHVYHFNITTLTKLIEAQGFEVVSLVTYDPSHSPGTTHL